MVWLVVCRIQRCFRFARVKKEEESRDIFLNNRPLTSVFVRHNLPFTGDLGDEDENVEQLCWGVSNEKIGDDEVSEHSSRSGNSQRSQGSGSQNKSTIAGNSTMDSTLKTENNSNYGDEENEDGEDRVEEDADYDEDEEVQQEPLALLVVHAAMHMLFLPQFTCDFFEEAEHDGMGLDAEEGLTSNDIAAKRREEEKQEKEDLEMRAEAGLGKTLLVEKGISLRPKPTSIIWAAGCSVTPNQVRRRFAQIFSFHSHFHYLMCTLFHVCSLGTMDQHLSTIKTASKFFVYYSRLVAILFFLLPMNTIHYPPDGYQ